MIKNIIFDLAGVILNLNLERDTDALHGIGLPNFERCLADPDLAKPLMDYLNGLTSEEDFIEEISPFCNAKATCEEILDAMDAVLDDIPKQRLEDIIELRKKYKVYLLSNIYEKAWEHTKKQFEKLGHTPSECFDKTFLSYEMGLAKPDHRIYEEVIKQTGIKPEETLYYDDSKSNTEAGRSMGFRSILVNMNELEIREEHLS